MNPAACLLRVIAACCCATFAAACQRYAPSPLDLQAHHARLLSREPARPDVVEFALRIGTASTGRTAYDPADGLSIPEAEVVALFFNPQLRLARERAKVPRAGAA